MRNYITYCFLLLICITYVDTVHAQLSPGPLTSAHSDLEGMSNCTQCHDIGQKVPDAKCLACHEEIQQLIDQGRGYHAHSTVRSQECIDCHSEHHGRKFDMVRFDTENFDHDLTSYTLEGTHNRTECRECHKSSNIKDPEIRKREKTYLGLNSECLSCHDDHHQGTLSTSCTECHDFEAFSPASRFDHDDTDYPLEGQHDALECAQCHTTEIRNGRDFQVFSGIAFNDCVTCHEDPHGSIPGSCSSCHTESSFELFRGQNRFNHSLTDYDLKGSHTNVSCFDCHDRSLSVRAIFSDHSSVRQNECASCHEDVHDSKFGTDCASCHNERSFHELNADMEFNHHLTDFPLLGMHEGLDCAQCHTGNFTDGMPFANCTDCHEDYHEGEFQEGNATVDCNTCHSVHEPFSYTSFGFEEHEDTDFPLEGAHLATPCFACHLSEDQWQFRDLSTKCVDCHEDIHESYIDPDYYPDKDCTICHITDSWAFVSYDHTATGWDLIGAHAEVSCRECHIESTTNAIIQSFNELENNCNNCHDDSHGGQFEINGITDCERCHNSLDWYDYIFDHSTTQFPLEGRHAELECVECHTEKDDDIRIFKIESFECIDCHS